MFQFFNLQILDLNGLLHVAEKLHFKQTWKSPKDNMEHINFFYYGNGKVGI